MINDLECLTVQKLECVTSTMQCPAMLQITGIITNMTDLAVLHVDFIAAG